MAQEDLRRKAVKAVIQEGQTQVAVARMFGVTRQAVGSWIKAYRRQGAQALKRKPQGRPKGGKLRPWQAALIARVVMDRRPEQLKLPFDLWTREAVAQLIKLGSVLRYHTVRRTVG